MSQFASSDYPHSSDTGAKTIIFFFFFFQLVSQFVKFCLGANSIEGGNPLTHSQRI